MATSILPMCELQSEINVPVTITDTPDVTGVREYFRYSKYGKLVIVDFGGIYVGSTTNIMVYSNLPIMRTRFVVELFEDKIQQSTDTTLRSTGFAYTQSIGSNRFVLKCPANAPMYGQAVYLTD